MRARLGIESESFEVASESITVAELWPLLVERHPDLDGLRRHLRVAVNFDFAADDDVIGDGAEVGIIPPVAGGQSVMLTEGVIDAGAVEAAVARPEAGALVTFRGVVRNHARGKRVSYLEYEVYPEMARAKLAQVIEETENAFEDVRCAVVHRYGRLEIGDVAVVIAVSSPHRAEAFTACASAIDRIKEIVPIWKHEVSPDGDVWVGMGS